MDCELYHHGIKGMKWGVRHDRKSNGRSSGISSAKKIASETGKLLFKAGSSTEKGLARGGSAAVNTVKAHNSKKRIAKVVSGKAKAKDISEMSDDELRAATQRLQLEAQYKSALQASQGQSPSQPQNQSQNQNPGQQKKHEVANAIENGLKDGLRTSTAELVKNSSYIVGAALINAALEKSGKFEGNSVPSTFGQPQKSKH